MQGGAGPSGHVCSSNSTRINAKQTFSPFAGDPAAHLHDAAQHSVLQEGRNVLLSFILRFQHLHRSIRYSSSARSPSLLEISSRAWPATRYTQCRTWLRCYASQTALLAVATAMRTLSRNSSARIFSCSWSACLASLCCCFSRMAAFSGRFRNSLKLASCVVWTTWAAGQQAWLAAAVTQPPRLPPPSQPAHSPALFPVLRQTSHPRRLQTYSSRGAAVKRGRRCEGR